MRSESGVCMFARLQNNFTSFFCKQAFYNQCKAKMSFKIIRKINKLKTTWVKSIFAIKFAHWKARFNRSLDNSLYGLFPIYPFYDFSKVSTPNKEGGSPWWFNNLQTFLFFLNFSILYLRVNVLQIL